MTGSNVYCQERRRGKRGNIKLSMHMRAERGVDGISIILYIQLCD
jgi:hypothetical protein